MPTAAIIGVTGYGNVQLNVLHELHKTGAIALKAAVVVNPDQATKQLALLQSIGARVYSSDRAMWAEEGGQIDLCVIPAPIALHAPMSIAAMEAGAHVFVEKPLAGVIQDARRIIEASERTGKFVAVGFQDLHAPEIHSAKERILAGEIGEVHSVRGFGLWPRPPSYYSRNGWAGRLRDRHGWVLDCPFSNAMAHFLNLCLFLGGPEPHSMAGVTDVEGDLYRVKDIETFDVGAVRCHTANGPVIHFTGAHACADCIHPVVRVEGTLGFVEWSHCRDMFISRHDGQREDIPLTPFNTTRFNTLADCVRRLNDPSAFICTAEMALIHVAVFNAMFASTTCTPVDPEWIVQEKVGGEISPSLRGATEAVLESHNQALLFREIKNLPWATATGTPFPLSSLTEYALA